MTIEGAIKNNQRRTAEMRKTIDSYMATPRGRELNEKEQLIIAKAEHDYTAMLAIDEYLIGYQTILLHIQKQAK